LKYGEPPPWDLAVAALLSATLIILVFLSPEPALGPAATIGLAIVFFLPGYSLTVATFPGRSALSSKRRLLFSTIFSIILAAIAALILASTPRGLNADSLVFLLSILALGLTIAAYLRWSALPKRRRYTLGFDERQKSLKSRRRQMTPTFTLIILGLIVIAAVSAIGFVANHNSDKQNLADLVIIEPESKSADTPIDIVAGTPQVITAKIKHQENRLVNYTLVLALNKSTLFSKPISLDPNQSWQGPLNYTINEPGNIKKLSVFLYKERDLAKPYKEAYLMLNVSRNTAINNLKSVNYTKKSVVLDEKGRFVVMGDLSHSDGENKLSSKHSRPASTNLPMEELPEKDIIEKESTVQNQAGKIIKNPSNSETDNPQQIQPNVDDSQQNFIRTAPIIGIEINQLDANGKGGDITVGDGTLEPILNVKGDKSGEPQQVGVAETTTKIELATEKSLQVSDQDQGQSKSTDIEITNSKDLSQPVSQEAKSSEEKLDGIAKANDQNTEEAKALVGLPINGPNSGTAQTDQEDKSTLSNVQSRAEDSNSDGMTGSPTSDSGVPKQEGAADNIAQDEKKSEMEIEIDSWIESGGVTPSNKDENSFITKNIRYVKQGSGGKAVLGRSSRSSAMPETNSQGANLS
jgi:uncharacterized membrane protein